MADHQQITPDETLNPHARGHQEDRINVASIGIFAVGLVVVVVVVFFAVAAMMDRFSLSKQRIDQRRPAVFSLNDPDLYPGARLQEDPGRDMSKMRTDVTRRLESYGWVDRGNGVAHIPIERAMQITAENGLPARDDIDRGDSE
ncbi:hypothetical protein [Tautonia plasticadhaerens]|uniref:Uncharacterized protein n=1 Tax=Tautonia plasticadhaerens TaxID=2527974 RepID=A0A518H8B7_9BACT|nr:hypothetical protein [Tautonia plasticadhaerens]QDV37100.1 hypothetical protein ElP_50330 [Tautonia plasticadhaerens]